VRYDQSLVDRVRVLVADDHPVFRDGLARAMAGRHEIEVAGEVADGRAALAAIRSDPPTVALVDLRLPGVDGIGVASAVTRDALGTRVVILSAFDDPALVYRALEAGAAGYLTKDAKRDEITDAVMRVSRGETVIAPALAGGLATQIRQRSQSDAPILTERERQVLVRLCEGRSAPEIAKELYLGVTTVKTHLAHLYDKLGVSDRAAAVAEAMRRGLVE
jgi:two-component system nitrate/nitrite response regulator NarL